MGVGLGRGRGRGKRFSSPMKPPGDGRVQLRSPARWAGTPWTRALAPPVGSNPGSCLPSPAPPPPARGWAGRHPLRAVGASQLPVGFRPYPLPPVGGWAGSGRVAGTAAGAAGGFLGHRGGGQKSVRSGPLGGAHQSAWSLYISILGRRTQDAGRSTQHAARSTASALANGKRRHQHLPKWLFRGVHPGKIKAGPSTPGAV
jgi:hypothetical protein